MTAPNHRYLTAHVQIHTYIQMREYVYSTVSSACRSDTVTTTGITSSALY